MKKVTTLVTAVLASGILILSACTATPAPPPDRGVTATVSDRDASVKTEVMTLQPCALLQAAGSADYVIVPQSIYACSAQPADREGPLDDITVTTWVEFTQTQRFSTERLDLGGAVAYRSAPQLPWCDVWLPVDFSHAIQFHYEIAGESANPCAPVTPFAEAVASALIDDPGAFRRPAGASDAIEACPLFEAIVGDDVPDDMLVESRGGVNAGLLDCGTWIDPETRNGILDVMPGMSLQLGYGRSVAELHTHEDWAKYELRSVRDTSVLIQTGYGSTQTDCALLWDVRPAIELDDTLLRAELTIPECDDIDTWLDRAIPVVAGATSAVAAGTQVLYAAGEPDGPVVGPCADARAAVERACVPARDVVPPADAEALLSQGDPDALCAAFAEPVTLTFARDFAAVTLDEDGQLLCEFVTDDHSLVVAAWISAASVSDAADLAMMDVGEVGGHPGVVLDSEADGTLGRFVAALSESGPSLHVSVRVWPTRTDGYWDTSPIDRTPIDNIDEIADDLVAAVLG